MVNTKPMRSSKTAATTPPWARLGAPSNAGPRTTRDTASSPSRKNCTSRPMGLASPDTTQSGNVPIGAPLGRALEHVALHGLDRSAAAGAGLHGGQPHLHLVGDRRQQVLTDVVAHDAVPQATQGGGGPDPREHVPVVSRAKRHSLNLPVPLEPDPVQM